VINGRKYRFAEMEFYFTSKNHDDPFTHKDETQQQCGLWYFHRTNGQYRDGNYKGLDITIGDGKEAIGGILIRSIQSLDSTGTFVHGPCKTVDHILELSKTPSIKTMVNDLLKGHLEVSQQDGSLRIQPKGDFNIPKANVFRSPRVGLHMNKKKVAAQLQQQFIFKYYRFFILPKKMVKGRHLFISGLHHLGKSKADIKNITGATTAAVDKFVQAYEEGKQKKKVEDYFGQKLESDDDICRCFGTLYRQYAE